MDVASGLIDREVLASCIVQIHDLETKYVVRTGENHGVWRQGLRGYWHTGRASNLSVGTVALRGGFALCSPDCAPPSLQGTSPCTATILHSDVHTHAWLWGLFSLWRSRVITRCDGYFAWLCLHLHFDERYHGV